ncbi:hypothetical protein WJX73_010605 [Symbiochloris irregularis]|uniref:Uncharacterized protein n=1 Tax=Symbiochloris irregularis TaxID=706552 RepID=A0AAW1PYF8_9CHLO
MVVVLQCVPSKDLLPYLEKARSSVHTADASVTLHEQQMWLQKIFGKIEVMRYTNAADLLQDIELLRPDCEAKDSKGSCQRKAATAQLILDTCQNAMGQINAELSAAEKEINKTKANQLPPPSCKPSSPMLIGLQRVIKIRDDRIDVLCNVNCPNPEHQGTGASRLFRKSQLSRFFKRHAGCRPEWQKYAKQASESAEAYKQRVDSSFDFGKIAAMLDPCVQVEISGCDKPDCSTQGKVVSAAIQRDSAEQGEDSSASMEPRSGASGGRKAASPTVNTCSDPSAAAAEEPLRSTHSARTTMHASTCMGADDNGGTQHASSASRQNGIGAMSAPAATAAAVPQQLPQKVLHASSSIVPWYQATNLLASGQEALEQCKASSEQQEADDQASMQASATLQAQVISLEQQRQLAAPWGAHIKLIVSCIAHQPAH